MSAPARPLTRERERELTMEFISRPHRLSNAEFDTLIFFLESRGMASVPDIEWLN